MRTSFAEGVALAVAVVVLVVAIVGVSTRDTFKKALNDAVSASATPSPLTTTENQPSTVGPGSSPATRGAAPPAKTPVPAAPVPAGHHPAASGAPPRPGRYDYSETNSNGTRQSTLAIASQGSGKQTENTDGGSTIDEVAWRSTGKIETATTFSFPNGSFRCVWNPSFIEYKFPLRIGSTWTVHTTCHPNAKSSITLDGTSRVTADERRLVGGTNVDDWIIVTDATIKFSGNGSSFSEAIRDEDHFAPSYGVTVYEVATTTDTDPSGLQTRDRTVRDLESLKPSQTA